MVVTSVENVRSIKVSVRKLKDILLASKDTYLKEIKITDARGFETKIALFSEKKGNLTITKGG